jgi:hypothetical protein
VRPIVDGTRLALSVETLRAALLREIALTVRKGASRD